jgi:hypothetical protein
MISAPVLQGPLVTIGLSPGGRLALVPAAQLVGYLVQEVVDISLVEPPSAPGRAAGLSIADHLGGQAGDWGAGGRPPGVMLVVHRPAFLGRCRTVRVHLACRYAGGVERFEGAVDHGG